MEYYTSQEEAESSVADQTYSPTIHGGQRGASDDDEQTLLCLECGAIGDVLEEGGDSAEFTCDECLMKVHPECEDPGCAVCRETAAVVEARWSLIPIIFLFSINFFCRWIMRSRLETPVQDSGEEEWVTGVEGDSGSQSSDGTDQEPEYCDQTGRGGDWNFSTIGGARGGDCVLHPRWLSIPLPNKLEPFETLPIHQDLGHSSTAESNEGDFGAEEDYQDNCQYEGDRYQANGGEVLPCILCIEYRT